MGRITFDSPDSRPIKLLAHAKCEKPMIHTILIAVSGHTTARQMLLDVISITSTLTATVDAVAAIQPVICPTYQQLSLP